MDITTREQYHVIEAIAQWSTIKSENVNHLIATYKNYVRNEYVCSSCPSKLWQALQAIKELYQRIKKTWEERNAEEDVKGYVAGSE